MAVSVYKVLSDRVEASEEGREQAAVEAECVAACPQVLQHLCAHLSPSAR